jgi:hypothetical protein
VPHLRAGFIEHTPTAPGDGIGVLIKATSRIQNMKRGIPKLPACPARRTTRHSWSTLVMLN